MNSHKFHEIFSHALEISVNERNDFLARECAGDDTLFRKIQSLLESDLQAEEHSFLDKPAFAIGEKDLSANFADTRIGQIVGGYKIVEIIGEGGMGAVYLATRADGQFEKRVAVKFIKRGMDTDAVLRRFLRERQILANLEHPNIARMLDAGMTNDGLPFFVMELVEGMPIDKYCCKNDLSLIELLKLFRTVCQTVTHAHQNLIVHRDLKPSNILVTKDGEPKLLDFGIAKLLNQETYEITETVTGLQALTPEYASPEQIRGEKLTTATDIYSLGVILYELVTNNRPYKISARRMDEMIQAVCEQTPIKPSTELKNQKSQKAKKSRSNPKSVSGDLDNIILCSLQKEPLRRYKSVEQFGEDIRRYLENLPVVARPDTFDYRAKKFVERNKIGVFVAAFIFLLLVGGIFAVSRQARIAEIEREKAERRAENLRKLSSSFAVELHDAILNLPGSLEARKLLLTRAVEQLDGLAADSEGNKNLQSELAAAYYNLGELPAISLADAEQNYGKSLAFYENLAADSTNPHFQIQIAKVYGRLANIQKMRGDLEGAISYNQKRISILNSLAVHNFSKEILENLTDAYYETAGYIHFLGKARESLNYIRASLETGEKLIKLEPENKEYKHQLIVEASLTAASLEYLGNYREAIVELQKAVEESKRKIEENPHDVRYLYEIWAYKRRLGIIFEQNGDNRTALENLREATQIMENLLRKSPDDTGYQRNAAFSNISLGRFLVKQNQSEKAVFYLKRALELSENLVAADSERGESLNDLAAAHQYLGGAMFAFGRQSEAIGHFRRSSEIYRKILGRNAQNVLLKCDYAEFLTQFAAALISENSDVERRKAVDFYRQSLAIWQKLENDEILSDADAKQPELTAQKLHQAEKFVAK